MANNFTWVETHKQLVQYLSDKENDQLGLIDILRQVGITPLNDKGANGEWVDLTEIDPFTFFCYIYKYGSTKRLKLLQDIARLLNLLIPTDDHGIPSANPQKVWLFPYKGLRKNNEIARLWKFFFSIINENITNEIFADVLSIRNVGKTKLTEALFDVNPEKYLPINGPTKQYIESVLRIDSEFKTYTDYIQILDLIKSKTDIPFYELSYIAWQETSKVTEPKVNYDKKNNKKIRYWAGGFGVGESFKTRLIDFIAKNYWAAMDYTEETAVAKRAKGKFKEIKIGDYFAIKGFGGTNDLTLHYVGKVINIDSDNFRLDFEKINIPLFKGKAPKGKGAGNWFDTILEVKREEDISMLFYDKSQGMVPVIKKKEKMNKTLNQILFGPPGTGKTYKLSSEYFERFTSRESTITKDEFIRNSIADKSWWEVIALVLMELGRAKVADILNHDYLKIKIAVSNSTTVTQTIWGQLQSHTIEECKNVKVAKKSNPLIFNKTDDKLWEIVLDEVEQQVPELQGLLEEIHNFEQRPKKEIKRFEFLTFHQSFSYEDFIEGIKPCFDETEDSLKYVIEDGVFKKIAIKAKEDPDKDYAIFIDEINRGNVAAIFGELITLIEDDKREGCENELEVILPYSKTKFSVPSNLYLIGTMNTADRSVEALDTALRRRFSFVEMAPKPKLIQTVGKSKGSVEGFDLVKMLKTINDRIEKLIDRDHMIGHSYFLSVETMDNLKAVFQNKIIPLLQEYFFGDYGKIGLVLGSGFFENEGVQEKNEENIFASFNGYDADLLTEKPIYHLKNEWEVGDFERALNMLMENA